MILLVIFIIKSITLSCLIVIVIVVVNVIAISLNMFDGYFISAGLPLGAATGPLGMFTAIGCFLAAGGGCAACVSFCLGAGATPTP